MRPFWSVLNNKSASFLILLFINGLSSGQSFKGIVVSDETKTGIGYVNVGIIGENIGTVTDQNGVFTIELDTIYDKDSIRFSMIGYKPKAFLINDIKKQITDTILLCPRSYYLTEVKIIYHRSREIILGTPVAYDSLRSGFSENNLGSELGIRVNSRVPVRLDKINLNVSTCTYDSVTYRLNIYQITGRSDYKNILTQPIYISFSKDEIKDLLTFDLRKYSIIIEGEALITLELYKDLGEGRLLFHTQFFRGFTYHKKTSEGKWSKAPGQIGMYINGHIIRKTSYKSRKF